MHKGIKIRLYRDQLLYDIRNHAYIESHVVNDDSLYNERLRHLIADLCEDGNIDCVDRILATAHARLQMSLNINAPMHAHLPHRVDNVLRGRVSYVVLLPPRLKASVVHLASHLAHDFMVCEALKHWLLITWPEAEKHWATKADELLNELQSLTFTSPGVTIRASCPF